MNTGRQASPEDEAPEAAAPPYQPPPSAYVAYVDLLHLRPPRVWPIFVAFVLFPVAAIGLSLLVFVLALVGPLSARRDVPPEEFRRMLEEANARPAVFLSQFLLMALLLAGITGSAAALSPVPWRRRLRLVRPPLTWHGWLVVLTGTLAVAYALNAGLDLLGLQDAAAASRTAGQLRSLSGPLLAVGVVLMGTAAAVVEELFFRGYAQSRLVERWGVWRGILWAAALNAVLQFKPPQVAATFITAVWLGTVTERAGSVWPTLLTRSLLMTAATFLAATRPRAGDTSSPAGLVAALAVAVACFWYVLPRRKQRTDAA